MLTNYSRMSTFLTFAPLHFRRMLSHLFKKKLGPAHMTISRGLPNVAYVFFVCKRSASAVLFSTIFWGFTCLDKCLSSEGKSGRRFFALRLRLEIKTSRCVWKCGVRFTFELKDSSMYYSCICIYIYMEKYYVHIHVTYDYICGIIYDMNKITQNCAFSRLRRASICWKSWVPLCALHTRNHVITFNHMKSWSQGYGLIYFSLMYRTGKKPNPLTGDVSKIGFGQKKTVQKYSPRTTPLPGKAVLIHPTASIRNLW